MAVGQEFGGHPDGRGCVGLVLHEGACGYVCDYRRRLGFFSALVSKLRENAAATLGMRKSTNVSRDSSRQGYVETRGKGLSQVVSTKLFSELGLSEEVLKAIDKLGFEQAAPIQAEAIPHLMAGRDVVGQSQTGSGKTVAFAAPAIEKVDPAQRTTQVLILCPTRELAVQVSEEVHKLALFKRGLHSLPVHGGQSYERQLMGLRQGAHIVIGTPGRLMDHMRRGTLRLNALKMVVLDEVDVMLNMGFR
jgi:superfamily II DNA/RNA helicase